MLKNTRILITGGAGFIGSNLVEAFLQQDNEVACLDNFSTGKRENIHDFLNNKNFKLIEGDIRNLKACQKACNGIDYIFHHAAIASVPRSIKDPITSTGINIMGTLNMLIAARDSKVKRFIYAASSSTYGDDTSLPNIEDKIGKPLSPYAITKYVNELYAENFSRLYGIETVGLRYFNVFGRRQDPLGAYAAVIPKFIISLIRHESSIINGDGTYSRDFTYIDNIIQANELAALVPSSKLNTGFDLSTDNHQLPVHRSLGEGGSIIFNIAYGERTSINELFYILRDNLSLFDSKIAEVKPIYGQEREGDIAHSLSDISKARNLLGYTPEYSVKEGLEKASKWYWENLKTI
jgi:UDP-N-acetylglucosamine 4-epimerase